MMDFPRESFDAIDCAETRTKFLKFDRILRILSYSCANIEKLLGSAKTEYLALQV